MNDKDILLVMPSTDATRSSSEINNDAVDSSYVPLSILSLAGDLEARGHKTRILDTRAYGHEEARKILAGMLDDVWLIGFSVMTASVREALDLSRMIKKERASLTVVWGGVHPTPIPNERAEAKRGENCQTKGKGYVRILTSGKTLRRSAKSVRRVKNCTCVASLCPHSG